VSDDLPVDTLLYTTAVINTSSGVRNDINMARERVMSIVLNPIRREASVVLEEIRVKDDKRRREIMEKPGCSPCDRPAVDPTYGLQPATKLLICRSPRRQIAQNHVPHTPAPRNIANRIEHFAQIVLPLSRVLAAQ
jgi:hypothetical protein